MISLATVEECWHTKGKGKGKQKVEDQEANVAHEDSDSNIVLLMVTTTEGASSLEAWYLGIGCFNCMTRHKEWLIDLDTSRSKKVKLADSRTLNVEGVGNILIRRKDGKTTFIESVLFVPGMQCNLMSVGQLVEKGFSVIMQNDSLKLFDPNKRLVLRSSLSKNITFQANINVAYAKCGTAIVAKEESCLWHLRFGPLNFRSLSQLQSKDKVIGLPNVHVPDRMCKVCNASKQPRNSFCSYLPMR
ncbi:uncharacterized protein LOC114410848 [Glycine soja]|uniref:uncharacterized protein LOC114410848 n=1 Tax=Glycine soja TaxID=3848 RepID=UPI00103A0601|nr:uncharacterized protein LOC114410848 [Glycine soja]